MDISPFTELDNASKLRILQDRFRQWTYDRAKPIHRKRSGMSVVAKRCMDAGTLLTGDDPAAIALDAPHRQSHCAYCAIDGKKDDGSSSSTTFQLCPNCQAVGCCHNCAKDHEQRHSQEECEKIQKLGGIEVDPCLLLVIRLLWQADLKIAYKIPDIKLLYKTDLKEEHEQILKVLSSVTGEAEKTRKILSVVLGCGHALVDVSLPLGQQTIGRALFVQQSFFNHSCAPNAYLSSILPSKRLNGEPRPEWDPIVSRIHLLRPVQKGEEITISYIPLSGLSLQERQSKLLTNYGFQCHCSSCKYPYAMKLPDGADVDSIREIQYECNETLLRFTNKTTLDEEEENELERVIATIQMTKRGITNQGLSERHEVAIEAERLLALVYLELGKKNEAVKHHKAFSARVNLLGELFDPLAKGLHHLEFSRALGSLQGEEESNRGIEILGACIGNDHPWLRCLQRSDKEPQAKGNQAPERKRRRL